MINHYCFLDWVREDTFIIIFYSFSFFFLILFISTKKNLEISLSLLFGMVFHLILDLPEVPLFYPFVSYDFVILEEPLFYWITKFFADPVVIITEITGIGILIYIFITNKLYHRSKFMQYLKGNSQSPIRIKK